MDATENWHQEKEYENKWLGVTGQDTLIIIKNNKTIIMIKLVFSWSVYFELITLFGSLD